MENQSLDHAKLIHIALWLIRRYQRFQVTGYSMSPGLRPPQEVLIDPNAYRQKLPHPGEIVVAFHPKQPNLRIIKRVLYAEPNGLCFLQGDNPIQSQDSRHFGLVSTHYIQGKAVCLLP